MSSEAEKGQRVEWQQTMEKGAGCLDRSELAHPVGKEPKLVKLRVV